MATARGKVPPARSSHRVCAVPEGILVFGGAPAMGLSSKGANGSKAKQDRFADLHLLRIDPSSGEITWQEYTPAAENGVKTQWPQGRAGHAQEWIGRRLYILGGYNKSYCGNIWEGQLTDCVNVPAVGYINPPNNRHHIVEGDWKSSRRTSVAGPAATTKAILPAKRGHEDREPADGEGEGSGAHWSELYRQLEEWKTTAEAEKAKSAVLLGDKYAALAEISRLQNELRNTDESWRAAAKERDRWKQQSEEELRVHAVAAAERDQALIEVTNSRRYVDEALQRISALQSQIETLQRMADDECQGAHRLREMRNNLQEQNVALQNKMTSEAASRARLEVELAAAQEQLASERCRWDSEKSELSRVAVEAKEAVTTAQLESSAATRRKNVLEQEVKELRDSYDLLQKRVDRADAAARRAEEQRNKAEESAAAAWSERQRLFQEMEHDKREREREIEAIHSAVQRLRSTPIIRDGGGR